MNQIYASGIEGKSAWLHLLSSSAQATDPCFGAEAESGARYWLYCLDRIRDAAKLSRKEAIALYEKLLGYGIKDPRLLAEVNEVLAKAPLGSADELITLPARIIQAFALRDGGRDDGRPPNS